MYELQKANMWKRISAALFDVIMISIVVVGLAYLLTSLLGYDSYTERLEAASEAYEHKHGVSFDVTAAEHEAMSEDELVRYEQAWKDFSADKEVSQTYGMIVNLTLIIITFSFLLAFLALEFAVPLLFGNGQTLGKKVFGIGVMRWDGVKLSPLLLFARTVLGKYTVETMVPVLVVIMIYFNFIGIVGTAILFVLLVVQLVLLASTYARTPIHDKLAQTVTVDLASQRIFEDDAALMAYKQQMQAEKAAKAPY